MRRHPAGDADVIAARSPTHVSFFTWIMRRRMARAFHAVRVAGPHASDLPRDRALIVYSNHPAWWDPAFFIVLMDTLFPGRRGFGPMEAAALDRYRFMRRIGVFGIDVERYRGAACFLRTARRVLADPERMLWMTAEGAFADPRRRPVRLRGGVARLMTTNASIAAVPLALEYPFWSESRPEALCRFGAPLIANAADRPPTWQARLETALAATQDALANDARARDPARFRLLLQGTSGVGGVYDLARRLRAAREGERFNREHLPEDDRR